MALPDPVKISHKKDDCQRWPHRFHNSRPLPLRGRWIRYCPIYEKNDLINISSVNRTKLWSFFKFTMYLLRQIFCLQAHRFAGFEPRTSELYIKSTTQRSKKPRLSRTGGLV